MFLLEGNTSGFEEGLVLDRMAICARVNGLCIIHIYCQLAVPLAS